MTRGTRLIEHAEKDEEIKKVATEIKNKFRNLWVHPDLEEIEEYSRNKGVALWTDPTLNIAIASASLEPLVLTKILLTKLFVS